jgi:putative transposase
MNRKRKKHTEEMKARVALEAIKGVRTLSELSAAYGVHPTVIAQWKRQLIERAAEVFTRGNAAAGRSEQELTAPLYEEIGRLKMEIDWLKKKL